MDRRCLPLLKPRRCRKLFREVGILQARLGESEHIERTSAPEQLLELEYVYAAAPVGLLIVDRELRYVRINERLASMNGKPVAAHIGRTLREVIPDKAHLLEPLYRKVLDTGIEVSGYEISIPSSQGKLFRYLLFYPLRSASGEIIGVCGAIQDVTAEREAETEFGKASPLSLVRGVFAGIRMDRRQRRARRVYEPSPDRLCPVFRLNRLAGRVEYRGSPRRSAHRFPGHRRSACRSARL